MCRGWKLIVNHERATAIATFTSTRALEDGWNMKALLASSHQGDVYDRFPDMVEAGYVIEQVSPDTLIARLKANLDPNAIADIILIEHDTMSPFESRSEDIARVAAITQAIRDLPSSTAMADGRRWSTLPILFFGDWDIVPANNTDPTTNGGYGGYFVPGSQQGGDGLAERCDALISDYRQRLLAEYDDLGFLISEDHGRLRLGPALSPRESIESELYHGPADRRNLSHWVTVSRDVIGIAWEAELFEALINKANVTELELQKFFEEYPHFLTMQIWSRAIAHPRLPSPYSEPVLIPDFVLEPIVAERRARDSQWQILELKRPQDRLLTYPAGRAVLSRRLAAAIAQLRSYRTYFENPANTGAVERALGHAIRRPALAVLIGRSEREDPDVLDAQQEHENVRIVTYDEILDRQRALVRRWPRSPGL
jgi:hypothetical protein